MLDGIHQLTVLQYIVIPVIKFFVLLHRFSKDFRVIIIKIVLFIVRFSIIKDRLKRFAKFNVIAKNVGVDKL